MDEKAIRVLLDITEAVADVLRRHLPETEEANATEADLGARVRRLRKWRDFSQADLAERVGVDTSTICRIERSDRKSLTKYAHAIAKALHTTPEVILGYAPMPSSVSREPDARPDRSDGGSASD